MTERDLHLWILSLFRPQILYIIFLHVVTYWIEFDSKAK